MIRKRLPATRRQSRRQGVAVVELAVCLPVVVLIVLGTIEACTMIFLQQSLSIAAYEGARVSTLPNITGDDVADQCQQILADRGVTGVNISINPHDLQSAAKSSWIEVTASAPFAENSLVGGYLFSDRTLTGTVGMMKE